MHFSVTLKILKMFPTDGKMPVKVYIKRKEKE
jgi:hypothetical protein